jgi:hypothetical protein
VEEEEVVAVADQQQDIINFTSNLPVVASALAGYHQQSNNVRLADVESGGDNVNMEERRGNRNIAAVPERLFSLSKK